MATLSISQLAEEDLINIWLYIADDDPFAADAHLDKLNRNFRHLLDFPETGVDKSEVRANWPEKRIRFWPVDEYIIIYEIQHEGIQILRIFTAAMDFTRLSGNFNFD